MKLKVAMVAIVMLGFQGCVMRATAQKMYVQGKTDAFTELVQLQQRANVLDGCKDLVRRAFPETNAEGFKQIDARLTAAVNAPVVAPTPTPTPTPKKEKTKNK